MKRILKALNAFSLSLVLILALAVVPASAAENALSGDFEGNYAGYLVVLNDSAPAPFSADPFASATLMAAEDERAELLMLAEDWNIYKAASLDDIQSLVYAGRVAVVEPDYQAELFDTVPVEPNDPRLTTGQTNLTGQYGVQVRSAWEAGLTGDGVTVAVIDSGLNNSHEDMPLRVGRGRYFYYKEEANGRYELTINGETKRYNYYSSGVWTDNMGHGSMVCGLIAAATDNALGIAGIAPGATILPIRCFTATAGHVGGYTSNLISGINFAVENGADIINMSWGVKQYSASLQNAVDEAYKKGCILIAAAGNEGTVVNQYPAAWDNVISVGATDNSGRLCYYSQRLTSVNVCAPGGTSTSPILSLGNGASNSYLTKIGTSFSAPTVAAAAALLLQADPGMTQGDFLSLLQATSHKVTVDDHNNTSAERYSGAGRMDIQALLDAVGYASCSVDRTEDGFSVYTSYHPNAEDSLTNVMTIACGFNASGHMVESHSANPSATQYNNCPASFTFQNPTITRFETYYLDPSSAFSSLTGAPIMPVFS